MYLSVYKCIILSCTTSSSPPMTFDGRVFIIHHNGEPNRRRDWRHHQRRKRRRIQINLMPNLRSTLNIRYQVKLDITHSTFVILCPDLYQDLCPDLWVSQVVTSKPTPMWMCFDYSSFCLTWTDWFRLSGIFTARTQQIVIINGSVKEK